GGGDKPLIAGSFEKHVVITEDRVIEIDPDPQQSGCARTRHYASASLTVRPPQASCGGADAAVPVSSATDASAAAADRATVSVTRILESNVPWATELLAPEPSRLKRTVMEPSTAATAATTKLAGKDSRNATSPKPPSRDFKM